MNKPDWPIDPWQLKVKNKMNWTSFTLGAAAGISVGIVAGFILLGIVLIGLGRGMTG